MPSKAILHDAKQAEPRRRSWSEAVARRNEIAKHLDDTSHLESLEEVGVEIVRANARLDGQNQVAADGRSWIADHVVIATGSAPTIPPIDGLDDIEPWTSTDALTSSERPDRIIILGAGPIGSELSEVYRSYGSDVVVIDRDEELFSSADPAVRDEFCSLMSDKGIDMRLGLSAERVEPLDERATSGGVRVHLSDGSSLDGDRLLLAVGQTPRTEGLGLESIGLVPATLSDVDELGRVPGHDWLWAIGDVNGESPWTHGANREARVVANAITRSSHQPGRHMAAPMPRCVFTSPPLAHVGVAAHDHDREAVRGRARYSDIARFSTDELVDGVAVVAFDRVDRRIIGFSAVGPVADEVVATAAALIHMGATVDQARDLVFAFPTISQLLEAAIADAHDQFT
jgi:dihydrolipoamide dehydrogenase